MRTCFRTSDNHEWEEEDTFEYIRYYISEMKTEFKSEREILDFFSEDDFCGNESYVLRQIEILVKILK